MKPRLLTIHATADLRRLCSTGAARRLRERGGYGLREAALVIRVDPAVLARWETGVHAPSGRTSANARYYRFLTELVRSVGSEQS